MEYVLTFNQPQAVYERNADPVTGPPGLQPWRLYMDALREVPGLREVVEQLGIFESPGLMATASELIFEGLHLHQKLNKDRQGGRFAYHA